MNLPRSIIAASLDADRLCAIGAGFGPGGARVRSWASAQVPSGLDPRDSTAVGEWVRTTLDKAGVHGTRLVLAVPRGEVVLKRLKLPRGQGRGREADLASMVRLQMVRQLNFAIEGTAIDYMPVDGGGTDPVVSPAPGLADVLAGALPGERMAFLRGVASAAGLKIERVGLRSAGAAALLAQASRLREGSVLGVAAGWASIEFVVLERGRIVFARSADFGLATANGTDEPLARRVAVEAKRTWMAYRVGHDSAAVDGVAVLGEGDLARELSAACGEALELPATRVGLPAGLELPEKMPEADRLVALPLLGLLSERLLAPPTLDFAHPRRAPDLGARRRQLVLLGVLAGVVVVGTGIVLGAVNLGALRSNARDTAQDRARLEEQYRDFLLADARLKHVENWRAAEPDWLAHIGWLSDAMPDPRQAQLDALSGNLGASVRFATKDGSYVGGEWSLDGGTTFTLQGRAASREVADGLRTRLVREDAYLINSIGADTPDRFHFALKAAPPAPEDRR